MAEKKEKAKDSKKVSKKTDSVKSHGAKKKLFARRSAATVKEDPRITDYSVLIAPIVTEKSSLVGSQAASGPGTAVVFRVNPKANKDDIREAIERVFKVDVVKVRTANYLGKVKRTVRSQGRRASFKKAYITLKEGQTISVVEGI